MPVPIKKELKEDDTQTPPQLPAFTGDSPASQQLQPAQILDTDCIRIPPQLKRALALIREFGEDEETIAFVKKKLGRVEVPKELEVIIRLLS